jgi:hypothetical protein
VDPAIEADRQNLKDNVFRIKHDALWLYDEGSSMISLEHVRALINDPPPFVPGKKTAFCEFAAGGENVLAICEGNRVWIAKAWRERDTMAAAGQFMKLFQEFGLQAHQIGGDEGNVGHSIMDRMAEHGIYLVRVNNGSPSPDKPKLYYNLSAQWWSTVG